ncbi:MAG: hypothetical protein WDA74_06405 [Spirochaetota bacterium]
MNNLIFQLPKHPFDYLLLSDLLKSYSYPRNKINSLIKKGIIIRIKKGLYVLSPEFGGNIDHYILSNLIYGPSYISLDFALSFWNLIPERVEIVTCMTNKRNKSFITPAGKFTYKYINDSIFYKGVIRQENSNGSYMIASKEKALCDKIALLTKIKEKDLDIYLKDDLRIDYEELKGLDLGLLWDIVDVYYSRPVKIFVNWYIENFVGNK